MDELTRETQKLPFDENLVTVANYLNTSIVLDREQSNGNINNYSNLQGGFKIFSEKRRHKPYGIIRFIW